MTDDNNIKWWILIAFALYMILTWCGCGPQTIPVIRDTPRVKRPQATPTRNDWLEVITDPRDRFFILQRLQCVPAPTTTYDEDIADIEKETN